MKNFLKTDIFPYVILLGSCIFLLLQSSLAPFAKSSIGIDSSVFIYSAQQILDGQSMYKDIVDHKGPFLYFIDAMALFVFGGKYVGIWVFEVISLFVASVLMYKTTRLFADKISSLFAVITGILFLVPLLVGGNLTEEWALPYISLALYVFVAYLKENKPLSVGRLFILSFTFVLTLMLRGNLVAIWAGFGIVLLIKWVVEKKYKELIRNLSFLLLFVLLSFLPFFLYLYCKGIWSDFIYLAFKFNLFEYKAKSIFVPLMKCFLWLGGYIYLGAIPVFVAVYRFVRERTLLNGGILLAFGFTSFVCSLGDTYEHYFMIFSPLIVISYAYVFAKIKESIPNVKYIYLFILFLFFSCGPIIEQSKAMHQNYSEAGRSLATEKLVEVIIQNTKPEDKILVRDYPVSVYLYSKRMCATRFPYPLGESSLVKKHYVEDAEKALPELIIQSITVNSSDAFSLVHLLNDKYQLIETDIENAEIWKLNE